MASRIDASRVVGVGALVAFVACVDEASGVDERPTGGSLIVTGTGFVKQPMVPSRAPRLWAPFPPGKRSLCFQGPRGAGRELHEVSHDDVLTMHGLDLDTPNDGPPEPIVAALAGRVGHVQTGCMEGDVGCGGGFGNHVRLAHGHGYYSLYAHLESVAVAVGDAVGRGQRIGHEGNTGMSSGDHLHFGLHQGDARAAKVAPSVRYTLRNEDVTAHGTFVDRAASDHVCGDVGVGHVYRSDNVCSTVHDTRGSAKRITNDGMELGETCAVGDADYFRFGGGGGSFTATVTSTRESIADCSCAILDVQGHELEPGGPEGYARNDGYNGFEGCACSLADAPAGTYFLKVYAEMPGAYRLEKRLPR